ncbi:MAG: glutamine synthetase family protein [Lachnospiraceae bacterium]|nr:glutamine synthetase family protein [Lachnospiraceae bacterium]
MYTREQITAMVEQENVEFIRLQFTDLFGKLKNVAVTARQLEKAMDGQCYFDSTSITAFQDMINTDLYLQPDLSTFVIFPWRPMQGKVARMLCELKTTDGKTFDGDSRAILKKVIAQGKELGYTAFVRPEIEFFLLRTDDRGLPTTESMEKASYFDIGPLDQGEDARRDVVLTLHDMGIEVESSFHETAPEQHEVVLTTAEALEAADNIVTFRMAAKAVAARHGLHATFMPKPVYGQNGSGMHLEIKLYDHNGLSVFDDENDPYGLSETAYCFIAGILEHATGMMLITNPLVNSYKRFVPGSDAPLFVGWSDLDSSQMVRIVKKKGGSIRMEILTPDPSANPYLTVAALLAAGFEGIRKKMRAPEKVSRNFEYEQRSVWEEHGMKKLPTNLRLAVDTFGEDALMKQMLGDKFFAEYQSAKHREWDEFREQVTKWELDRYLSQY